MVTVSDAPGQMTLSEGEKAAQQERFDKVLANNLVKQVFEIFPEAELKAIHNKEDLQ